MTWVVAASTVFGYAAVYSDVQVTFPDNSTKDILQKTYPISNFIVVGFAGSVQIGFMLLQSLRDFLRMPEGTENSHAWDPVWVSNNWCQVARTVFQSAPPGEKSQGSQILMAGASPKENAGLGAKIYFTRFAAPDFHPGIMSRTIKVCSIGSGAGISEYKSRIKPLFRLSSGILQAEVCNQGGWARALGFSISRALNDHPKSGISRHLHIFHVRRGAIYNENNDENIWLEGETQPIEIRMPPIARGYKEFVQLATSKGHDIAEARC